MRLLPCALILSMASSAAAGEKVVPRYFEFRDGSVLRLAVVDEPREVAVVRGTGRIESLNVPLSHFTRVTFTAEPDFTRKRALLSAVQQLGADDFRLREQAHAALVKMGAAIRPDLEACLKMTRDSEIQGRLKVLLDKLPAPKTPAVGRLAAPFDRFHLKDQFWGYLGDQGIPVRVGGMDIRLGRKDVLAMSVEAPKVITTPTGPAIPEGFQRIGPGDFPPGCVEEAFEKTPEGRPLVIGENIEKLFVNKGFFLSTSVKTSHVSVNNFAVQGKSKGLSAATHEPLWTGEITVTFVEPGREDVPVGVTHFGCYIAAVVPKGTALHAFDAVGRELGKIHTEQNGTDFLGVRSSIPIYSVRIVPDVKIDRDYTLDDFIFMPVRTEEFSHPSRYAVLTAIGERMLCADVSFQRGELRLHGLPGGLPDRTVSATEVVRVNAPRPKAPTPPAALKGLYAELRDGSVIYGREPKEPRAMPVFARRPQALKEPANLVGVWATTYPRLTQGLKAGKPARWLPEEKRWQEISAVRFLEEVVLWKGELGRFESHGYRKVPPLWLSMPSAGPVVGSWHVRTVQGEDLVLAGPEALSGQMSRDLSAAWHGDTVRLPATEIIAIYQARAQK
jgi:hypothetical protein